MMQGMILAAGLGTRLKPFTEHHPKALALVNGETLLSRNIRYLAKYGVKDIIINVHHFADQIENFVQAHQWDGVQISISDERHEVLETGGGLLHAAAFFKPQQSFVLMNVDILTNLNLDRLIQFHQQYKPLASMAMTNRNSSRCFLWNANNQLCGWKNKNTSEEIITRPANQYTERAFSGIHVIDSSIFSHIRQKGKFSIVDTYLDLAKNHTILGFDHSGDILMDTGTMEHIQAAEKIFL
jgi:NDP-sugar pyrophosphorylase family protein